MNNVILKSSNILIAVVVLTLFIFLNTANVFSTSLLDVLPKSSEQQLVRNIEKNQHTSYLMVAIKNPNSFVELSKEILAIKYIKEAKLSENEAFIKHQKEHFYAIHILNEEKAKSINIQKSLEKLYTQLTNSFFPVIIDTVDPLNVFQTLESTKKFDFKKGLIKVDENTSIALFTIHSKSLDEHAKVYDSLQIIEQKHQVEFFSPIFFFVENSRMIKNDVNKIILLSMTLLFVLYAFLVRNIFLLINTVCTLATSSLIALIMLSFFYNQISIFVIAFGVAISTVAIDYMFHHYIHGYYKEYKRMNKEVLYGFITTVLAFALFTLCSFTLIKQIALFTVISLALSYMLFAFLYPRINFELKDIKPFKLRTINFPAKLILFVSLLLIASSFNFINLDINLKNLDVQNNKLEQKQLWFEQNLFEEKQMTVALSGKTLDELIIHAKQIQKILPKTYISLSKLRVESDTPNRDLLKDLSQRLNEEATTIGFKKDYFSDTYIDSSSIPLYNQQLLQQLGIDVMNFEDNWYYIQILSISDYEKIKSLSYVQSLSVKKLFEKSLENIFKEFLWLGLAVGIIIMGCIWTFGSYNKINMLNFIIFPLSMVLLFGVVNGLNILHLFMLFVILSLAIDYGFYTSHKQNDLTNTAIVYSLFSTFAGFAVLSISSINALSSIGDIAIIGIVSILFILFCSKETAYEN